MAQFEEKLGIFYRADHDFSIVLTVTAVGICRRLPIYISYLDFHSTEEVKSYQNDILESFLLNNYVVVNTSVYLQSENRWVEEPFVLWHSNLEHWKEQLNAYSRFYNITRNDQIMLEEKLSEYLRETEKIPEHFLSDISSSQLSTSGHSMRKVLSELYFLNELVPETKKERINLDRAHYFFTNRKRQLQSYEDIPSFFPRLIDYYNYLRDQTRRVSSAVPSFLLSSSSSRIVVYQTRNVFTGGTTAMRDLYSTLRQLGYPVILCNDTNYQSEPCADPQVEDIAITGEWCQEVLDEYLNPSTSTSTTTSTEEAGRKERKRFVGRGIQYYLGFHHGRHSCRGWIPTAVSHYLSQVLGYRQWHGIFLGCPMSERILHKLDSLLHCILTPLPPSSNGTISPDCSSMVDIHKENLLLVDYDLFQDYPPSFTLQVSFPSSSSSVLFQVLLVKGDIPAERMSYYLQRAKYVVDLAMPGAERLAAEGILFGAIPILSHRWNGASAVDYPIPYKIKLLDSDSLEIISTNTIPTTASNSNATSNNTTTSKHTNNNPSASPMIRRLTTLLPLLHPDLPSSTISSHLSFYRYILSLQYRSQQSLDLFFGSSRFHLVLYTESLAAEALAIQQIASWWFYYPLLSIDLYVMDAGWFQKHFYLWIDLLVQTGYLREDMHDPRHYPLQKTAASLLQIYSLHEREHHHHSQQSTRAWSRMVIEMPLGYVPRDPDFLFALTRPLDDLWKKEPETVRRSLYSSCCSVRAINSTTNSSHTISVEVRYYYDDPHHLQQYQTRELVDLPITNDNSNNSSHNSSDDSDSNNSTNDSKRSLLRICDRSFYCSNSNNDNNSSGDDILLCDLFSLPIWTMLQSFQEQLDPLDSSPLSCY